MDENKTDLASPQKSTNYLLRGTTYGAAMGAGIGLIAAKIRLSDIDSVSDLNGLDLKGRRTLNRATYGMMMAGGAVAGAFWGLVGGAIFGSYRNNKETRDTLQQLMNERKGQADNWVQRVNDDKNEQQHTR